jgi:hypothetical protein
MTSPCASSRTAPISSLLIPKRSKPRATHQMWVFQLFYDRNIIQLDVEVLVDALQRAAHRDIVLELDSNLMVHQRLEKAAGYRKSWSARALFAYMHALVLVRGVGPGWFWLGWAACGRRQSLVVVGHVCVQ